MNRNVLFVFFFSLFLILVPGCKTKKNVQRESTFEQSVERVESTIDKSITAQEAGSAVSIKTDQDIREFNRTTNFDSTGNVSSISETWRETGSSQLALRNDSTRNISLNNVVNTDSSSDQSQSSSTEIIDQSADSRPVQGIEWVWVILSAALVIAVAIYVIVNRKSKITKSLWP